MASPAYPRYAHVGARRVVWSEATKPPPKPPARHIANPILRNRRPGNEVPNVEPNFKMSGL